MEHSFSLYSGSQTMSPILRILTAIAGLAILVFLFWIGLFVVLAIAGLGVGLAVVNAIKVKLTGRPLFYSRFRRHFEEAQRRAGRGRTDHTGRRGRVIEGEVVDRDDERRSDNDRRD